jgi:hypothetical protein
LVEKFLAAELKDDYAEIAGEAYVQIDLPGEDLNVYAAATRSAVK